jgi:hypothetical protein
VRKWHLGALAIVDRTRQHGCMNFSKRLVVAATAGLSLAGVLVAATPAQAVAGLHWAWTSDNNPGGRTSYIDSGNKIVVCDNQHDGYNVLAYIGPSYKTKKGKRADFILKNTGDKKDCVWGSIPNAKENQKIHLQVGLYKKSDTRKWPKVYSWGDRTYTT